MSIRVGLRPMGRILGKKPRPKADMPIFLNPSFQQDAAWVYSSGASRTNDPGNTADYFGWYDAAGVDTYIEQAVDGLQLSGAVLEACFGASDGPLTFPLSVTIYFSDGSTRTIVWNPAGGTGLCWITSRLNLNAADVGKKITKVRFTKTAATAAHVSFQSTYLKLNREVTSYVEPLVEHFENDPLDTWSFRQEKILADYDPNFIITRDAGYSNYGWKIYSDNPSLGQAFVYKTVDVPVGACILLVHFNFLRAGYNAVAQDFHIWDGTVVPTAANLGSAFWNADEVYSKYDPDWGALHERVSANLTSGKLTVAFHFRDSWAVQELYWYVDELFIGLLVD